MNELPDYALYPGNIPPDMRALNYLITLLEEVKNDLDEIKEILNLEKKDD